MSASSGGPDVAVGAFDARLALVAITPAVAPETASEAGDLRRRVVDAAAGGATAIMLRHPGASTNELIAAGKGFAALAEEQGFFFILNGAPEIALEIGAGGVHLGVRTVDPAAVRRIARRAQRELLIGYSAHYPLEDQSPQIEAADYVTYSPIFATPSKAGAPPLGVEELWRAVRTIGKPVIALGGMGPDEAYQAGCGGCRHVAAISAVLGRHDARAAARAIRTGLSAGLAAGREH